MPHENVPALSTCTSQGCKIDACVDEFLIYLKRICPLDYDLSNLREALGTKHEKDQNSEGDESSEEGLDGTSIKQQLIVDLGRLAPRFVHANSVNGSIDLNRVLPMMRTRWSIRRSQLGRM